MATRSVLVLLVVLGLTACLPCVPVRYRVQAGDLRGRAVLQSDVPVIVDGREILVPVERVYSPAEATGERRWSDRLIQELAETHPEAEITLVSRQERCVPGYLTLAAGALAAVGAGFAVNAIAPPERVREPGLVLVPIAATVVGGLCNGVTALAYAWPHDARAVALPPPPPPPVEEPEEETETESEAP